jgi:translation initiation factor 4A
MNLSSDNTYKPREPPDSHEQQQSYEIKTWDNLDIDTDLLRGIYAYGFENPSPIQCKAILPIMKGRDVIAQSQSGTGKTAAFTIGLLSKIKLNEKTIQSIVLSPTRELSQQTYDVIKSIGSMMKDLKVMNLVGGTSIEEDIRNIKMNVPHIITGSPGRVYDMIQRNVINCKTVDLLILDEADEMLSYGFKDQIYNIFQYLNGDAQVAMFSATLPVHINAITSKILRDPISILVKSESLTLEGIKQYFVAIEDDRYKYDTLKELFSYITVSQCIIYCNSVKRVMYLYDYMNEDKFPVCCIHSNMDKLSRENSIYEFRKGKQRILISSDITARGIDVQQVSIVINFDLPKCTSTYLHRIGRSGRWGRKGTGINFITPRDVHKIKEIERFYSTQIDELPGNLNEIL